MTAVRGPKPGEPCSKWCPHIVRMQDRPDTCSKGWAVPFWGLGIRPRPTSPCADKKMRPKVTDYPEEFINKHDNTQAIILGSGPSIKDFPWQRLPPGLVTFGGNAIGKVFFPDYYVVTDKRAWVWYSDIVIKSLRRRPRSKLIVSDMVLASIDDEENGGPIPDKASVLNYTREGMLMHGDFEVGGPIFHGRTVGIVMLNLAFQMGFKKVYMIGIDGYSGKGPHYFYSDERADKVHKKDGHDKRDDVVAKSLRNMVTAMKAKGRELIDMSPVSAWDGIVTRSSIPWDG